MLQKYFLATSGCMYSIFQTFNAVFLMYIYMRACTLSRQWALVLKVNTHNVQITKQTKVIN